MLSSGIATWQICYRIVVSLSVGGVRSWCPCSGHRTQQNSSPITYIYLFYPLISAWFRAVRYTKLGVNRLCAKTGLARLRDYSVLPIRLSGLLTQKQKSTEKNKIGINVLQGMDCRFSVEKVKGEGHRTSKTSRNRRICTVHVYLRAADKASAAHWLRRRLQTRPNRC